MSLPQFMQLPGESTKLSKEIKECQSCGFNLLFKQPDFNRNLGLWLVGFASVLTVLFAITDQNWWLVWSPMPAFFLLDRLFARKSDSAILCYKCEHIHRFSDSLKTFSESFPEFDLDTYDRVHYQDRVAKSST